MLQLVRKAETTLVIVLLPGLHLFCGECRELTSFDLASRLLTEKPNSRFENFMHESVQLGSKATVSAGCIVGKGSILGDRCSVKRSIIGSTCKLGTSVKIVGSIVMDNVIIEDNSHIQNSIICSESHLQVITGLSRPQSVLVVR